jgi:hypothetical protein
MVTAQLEVTLLPPCIALGSCKLPFPILTPPHGSSKPSGIFLGPFGTAKQLASILPQSPELPALCGPDTISFLNLQIAEPLTRISHWNLRWILVANHPPHWRYHHQGNRPQCTDDTRPENGRLFVRRPAQVSNWRAPECLWNRGRHDCSGSGIGRCGGE